MQNGRMIIFKNNGNPALNGHSCFGNNYYSVHYFSLWTFYLPLVDDVWTFQVILFHRLVGYALFCMMKSEWAEPIFKKWLSIIYSISHMILVFESRLRIFNYQSPSLHITYSLSRRLPEQPPQLPHLLCSLIPSQIDSLKCFWRWGVKITDW